MRNGEPHDLWACSPTNHITEGEMGGDTWRRKTYIEVWWGSLNDEDHYNI